MGVKPSLNCTWKYKIEFEKAGKALYYNEGDELKRLRNEILDLRLKKNLKEPSAFATPLCALLKR